ncbi:MULTISPECIES: DUF58 domain-containing protein [unclassified Moraxella]|uniref:DUF58 domain-containing protein n=1 Tax=unclassified Moraxella TaxID=2685852 RepID=UPI003AF43A79
MWDMRGELAQRFEGWFKRRSPRTTEAQLNLRNVYIFLSREGVMYVLLLVITFVAGINYGNNLVLGLCFLLASLLVITIHYTFAHLAGLHVKLIDIQHATVGEKVQVRLQVSSQSKQPHRQIRFSFGKASLNIKQPLLNTAIPQALPQSSFQSANDTYIEVAQIKEPQIISLWLDASQRGRLPLPKLTISTVYPLGILQAWSYVFLAGEAWVYPDSLAYKVQGKQFTLTADEQQASQQTQAGQEDFDQLDSYVAGESMGRISWGHLARGQGLLSKRFVDNVGQQQVLDYYQMTALTHEDKLRQLRYGVDSLATAQVAFRLRLPDGEGVVGQGQAFVQDSLLRLAKTP